jgi:hypothetical protein
MSKLGKIYKNFAVTFEKVYYEAKISFDTTIFYVIILQQGGFTKGEWTSSSLYI